MPITKYCSGVLERSTVLFLPSISLDKSLHAFLIITFSPQDSDKMSLFTFGNVFLLDSKCMATMIFWQKSKEKIILCIVTISQYLKKDVELFMATQSNVPIKSFTLWSVWDCKINLKYLWHSYEYPRIVALLMMCVKVLQTSDKKSLLNVDISQIVGICPWESLMLS